MGHLALSFLLVDLRDFFRFTVRGVGAKKSSAKDRLTGHFQVFFLAHLSLWLMVSYCDHWMSVVRLPSSVVKNCFKGHLILNY